MDEELCPKCGKNEIGGYTPCAYDLHMGYGDGNEDADNVNMCECCDECRYDCFLAS